MKLRILRKNNSDRDMECWNLWKREKKATI